MQDQLLAIERRLWTNDAAFTKRISRTMLCWYLGNRRYHADVAVSAIRGERRRPAMGTG